MNEIAKLAAKWRERAKAEAVRADRPHQDDATTNWHQGRDESFTDCADELEAAIAAAPTPPAEAQAVASLREMLELLEATQNGRVTEKHELDIVRDARAALSAQPRPESETCGACDGEGIVVTYVDPYSRGDVSSPEHAPCPECSNHPQPASAPTDDFNGDNAKLIGCIEALLSMDKDGVLVPHGIGGHARQLLSAAASRLAGHIIPASAPAGALQPAGPDDTKVICPNCIHQFRAIPEQVQRDMLAAGFEPPFTAAPSAPVEAEPGAVRSLVAAANAVLALYPGDDLLWSLESAVGPFNVTKPAECAAGCPPRQVCDYCQIANLAQQPAAVDGAATYRLLSSADEIRADDEFLGDDTVTWLPVGKEFLSASMCGKKYNPAFLQPMRRAIAALAQPQGEG